MGQHFWNHKLLLSFSNALRIKFHFIHYIVLEAEISTADNN